MCMCIVNEVHIVAANRWASFVNGIHKRPVNVARKSLVFLDKPGFSCMRNVTMTFTVTYM